MGRGGKSGCGLPQAEAGGQRALLLYGQRLVFGEFLVLFFGIFVLGFKFSANILIFN